MCRISARSIRPASCPKPCRTCRNMTKRPSSSNMAAMPWARKRPPRRSPATSCCWSRPPSIRSWGLAAARRSRPFYSRITLDFAAGLRITDAATIEIVEMVLAGSVNKQLVGYINEAGGKAVGLSGKDGNMVKASKTTRTMVDPDSHIEKAVDLGFVGDPEKVDLTLLTQLIGYELIPVLAPLATSTNGQQTLN